MDEDTSSPLRETLKIVEDAQRAVAAEAAAKVHASQLLQASLEGAASAVEALKRGKEANTKKWLRDALGNLEWMQASLGEREEAEQKVAKQLEGAEKNTGTAQKLAQETASNKDAVANIVEEAVSKVRSAQDTAKSALP